MKHDSAGLTSLHISHVQRSVGDSRAFVSSFSGEKYSAPTWVCSKMEELADPHLDRMEREYGMKLAGDLPANRDNHTFGGESIEATTLTQADDTCVRNSLLSPRKAGHTGASSHAESASVC